MRFRTLAALLLGSLATTGCPSKETLGASAIAVLGPGIVNNPKNKSLRFDILKFGLEQFCSEMTRRGTPLRLSDDQPVLGRFFAQGCQSQVIDDDRRQALVVQYNGEGFAWTNLTGRIGFKSAGILEYAPDFQMHEGAMYIYFRPRNVGATSFEMLSVESAAAKGGMAALGVDPNQLGKQIVTGQLERGFTVIRYGDDGETDFGLGLVPVGERPFRPFRIASDKRTLANDRTEVHAGQQDYVGGLEVTEDDQALYITMALDGSAAVDVFLVAQPVGAPMIERYVREPAPAQLAGPTLLAEPLVAGRDWKRYVHAPKGRYWLVVDHTPAIGPTAPPNAAGDDRAARVDYAVQVGDAP
jgi:hypothetical protein